MDHSATVFAHSARKDEVAGVAHNMFLGVASGWGFVGLILFLGMLFFALKTAVPIGQRSDLGTGLVLGLIVFMLAGMTLSWEAHKAAYVLFGSVLVLQPRDNSARRAPSPSEQEGSR